MSKIIKSGDFEYIYRDKKPVSPTLFTEEDAAILYEEAKEVVQELINDAGQKAQQIIAEAHTIKQAALEEAQLEADSIKAEAYEEAFQSGWAAGEKQGLIEIEKLKEKVQEQIQLASAERARIIDEVEDDIVFLALAIAEKVIHLKIKEEQVIKNIVQDMLQEVKNSEFIVLKINAQAMAELNDHLVQLHDFVSPSELKLDVDNSLAAGEAIVISQMGVIEARIDSQLEKLKRALLEVKNRD